MARSPISPRIFAAAVAALVAPTAAVLIVVAATGRLDWRWAAAGGVAAAGAMAVIVWRHLAGLGALRRQVEALVRERAAAPDEPLATLAELSSAIGALNRSWVARNEALRASTAAGEAILESIPDPILISEGTGRIVRANAAARDFLGPGVVGRDLTAALRAPRLLEAVEAATAGGPVQAVDFLLPGPIERHFSARAVSFSPAGGRKACLLSLYDITAIRRAERMRADFVANVSHELRTPLASLIGVAETLRGPARDDAAARERFLAVMEEQAGRMSRLVGDLLSLSKIEENEHSPPTGRAAIGPIIGSIVAALAVQAKDRDIVIESAIAADLPPVVGDADQLAQVFQNLIDNALKYGRTQGKVRISARLASRPTAGAATGTAGATTVAVAVADDGEGIAREHLPRLTERFYRVDAGRSRRLGGTGLGLAIVKHIVNRHRGALAIDSEPGRGATFTVYLPTA